MQECRTWARLFDVRADDSSTGTKGEKVIAIHWMRHQLSAPAATVAFMNDYLINCGRSALSPFGPAEELSGDAYDARC